MSHFPGSTRLKDRAAGCRLQNEVWCVAWPYHCHHLFNHTGTRTIVPVFRSISHAMSSGNDASADNGASEPPLPSPAAPASPYDEERRILLNSVAESLAKVVGKMGTLNDQLSRTADSCREVEEVALVWREALRGGGDDGDGNRGKGDDDDDDDDDDVVAMAEAPSKATAKSADRSGD